MLRTLRSVIVLSVLLLASSALAADDCASANCHADKTQSEWVHGPVGAGVCSVCHRVTDEKKHQFQLAAEKEELCFACHDTSRDMMLEDWVHTPVGEGDCTECHDPHGSPYRFSLKGQAASLCFQCHDQDEFKGAMVHGPVAAGDCNVCHSPHSSAHEFQLREEKVTLCVGCHVEQADALGERHPHAPVQEDCTNCHQPHVSSEQSMLNDAPPILCFGCHTDLVEYANVETPHPPVQAGRCYECHAVHGSDYPKMFTKPAEGLCLSCHVDMQELVDESSHHHGPLNDGDCNACHDPHGSNNHRILREYFPQEFYTPYETSKYAMCFECHNQEIAVDEKTSTLTSFRDGERNLHFLHVNKEVKGRSCRACHQVHASNQEKHIRESVPYGDMDWELPVEFTKTENGGSCVVGCHSPKGYQR